MKNSRDVEDRVSEAMHHEHIETLHNENMSETSNANDGPLPSGTTILAGQYRLLELLHQRPRVNLYSASSSSTCRHGETATGGAGACGCHSRTGTGRLATAAAETGGAGGI